MPLWVVLSPFTSAMTVSVINRVERILTKR